MIGHRTTNEDFVIVFILISNAFCNIQGCLSSIQLPLDLRTKGVAFEVDHFPHLCLFHILKKDFANKYHYHSRITRFLDSIFNHSNKCTSY